MKQNLLYTFIYSILLISCKASEKGVDEKCPHYISKSIKNTKIDQFKYIVNEDTLTYNEVKFYCVYNTSCYTKKIMFDNFGKWNREIHSNGEKHPILLWEDIKLFEKDSTLFTIATLGDENIKTIYASFMAFDNEGNDLLKNNIYKEKLINYFKNLIDNSNPDKGAFYETYWKSVNSHSMKK
jgi:hypothetical protein